MSESPETETGAQRRKRLKSEDALRFLQSLPEHAQRERIIDRRYLPPIVLLSEPQIDRKVKSGDFPPPIRLSERRVGWRLGDVLDWLASRQKASDAA